MIRLTNILSEYWDAHEDQFNVLFVTDDEQLEHSGFIRYALSRGTLVGDIETVDKGTSGQLKNKVISTATPDLDLIVVFSRGIYDSDPYDMLRNFDQIVSYGNSIDTPVIFFGLPTLKFIKDDKVLGSEWSEQQRLKLNNVLTSRYDSVINLSDFDYDEYFKKDGQTFSFQGQIELYKLLRTVLQKFDINVPSIQKIQDKFEILLRKVQIKLIDLGYDIDTTEISDSKYGDSTKKAVTELAELLGYPKTEQLTTSIAKAILLLDKIPDIKIVNVDDRPEMTSSTCENPIYPGARQKYHPDKYTGTNGIESAQSLKTVRGTTLSTSAADWYDKMIADMNAAGIKDEGPAEGFRTYQTQYNIVDWDL